MSEPKVTEFSFSSSEGTAVIVIKRDPDPHFDTQRPKPSDLPEDIRASLSVWLAGHQP